MAVTGLTPPPTNVDANDWAFKKWFKDIYQYSQGGVLIPSTELTPIYPSRRNFLINGDFSIWQRGTSFVLPAATFTYTADRWCQGRGGAFAGETATRYTISTGDYPLPQDFRYVYNATRTAGDTNLQDITVGQMIETELATHLRGKTCVISFWLKGGSGLKSSLASNFRVLVSSGTGTDENRFNGFTGSRTALSAAFNAPTTWTYYQFPFTFNIDTNEASVLFSYRSPSNNPAVANENFLITGVQLEIAQNSNNPRATAFDYVPFHQQLAECCRYYQKSFDYDTTPIQSSHTLNGCAVYYSQRGGALGNMAPVNYTYKMRRGDSTIITTYSYGAATANWWNFTTSAASGVPAFSCQGDNGFFLFNPQVAADAVNNFLVLHWTSESEIR